ncbi:MAG: ectonucleotide pyrophosphatase/phosphodiesterase [Janthinobacterium lividum]
MCFSGCFGATAQQGKKTSAPPAVDAGQVVDLPGVPNNAHALKQHYVVLVSLDGFRYDYPQEHGAPNITALAQAGANAPNGMLPSYPSLTFPNHWTLVTGLRPEHHGIVRNSFYDPQRRETYSYKDSALNGDGTWYGGTPLWSLAEQQGMRAASFFWPGSEAEVAGERPDDYVHFLDTLPDEKRIDQVLAWLALPPAQRPHLITLYYSNTDHAGHYHGPDSAETREAVHHVDALVGELRKRLDATGLPVDMIVLADHGMVRIDPEWIQLDRFADLSHTKVQEWLLYPDSEAETEKVYAQFRAHPDPRFTVYRRKDVPAELHYSANARIGDPVIIPNGPYIAHLHATDTKPNPGDHGYDPMKLTAMRALFLANGPDIRKGVSLPVFPNVDVYDLIAKLLNLKPAANDGELGPLKQALKH